jgi:hypothetical protein
MVCFRYTSIIVNTLHKGDNVTTPPPPPPPPPTTTTTTTTTTGKILTWDE